MKISNPAQGELFSKDPPEEADTIQSLRARIRQRPTGAEETEKPRRLGDVPRHEIYGS